MRIGVVSDTHNNLRNIDTIIDLFNKENLELVIHTGDITNTKSLDKFKKLDCKFSGVYGNNDRGESGLIDTAESNGFNFQEPPHVINLMNRKIAVFHEPDYINHFLEKNKDLDIVLHGHTHRYRNEIKNGVLFFNPGESAGMLKGKNSVGVVNLKTLSAKRIFF